MTVTTQTPESLVYVLATSPNFEQDATCFAGTSAGLKRSEDGGTTWHDAYASLPHTTPLPTPAVVFSPDFVTDGTIFAGIPGAVLKSTDAGRHWSVAELPTPPPFVSALVISPNFSRDGIVLAGTLEDGVFRSDDGGSRWTAWNFGLLDLGVLCLGISPDFVNNETLFAGTDSGVYRSTNGGRAWRETGFPCEWGPVLCLALPETWTDSGYLLVGTESSGLFFSKDRYDTWRRLDENSVTRAVNGILLDPESPTTPHILIVHGDELLLSRDGGQSWSQWSPTSPPGASIVTATAPLGLSRCPSLLLGLADGTVIQSRGQ